MRLLLVVITVLLGLLVHGQKVEFSHESGKFDSSFVLKVTGDFTKLYYTTDGTKPTRESKKYKGELEIDESTILCVHPIFEEFDVDTVIARTYIIDFETRLPILSIAMDPEDLWNDSTGIYVKGKNAVWDDSTKHWTKANYQQRWEREVHVIYLDTNGKGFNQACGIKLHGESTRRQPDKSMKIIARKKYGKKRFKHKIYPQNKFKKYKHLVIRTSGNDYRGSRFKDALNAHLVRNMGLDYMGSQPIQLFVNGEYWGLYNLREKINEHYFKSHYKIDKDSVNVIMGRWVRQQGSAKDYMKMYRWFENLDTMDNAAWEKAQTMLDTRNYINFRVFQIYLNNSDSRGNIRYWNSPQLDGKFRMIVYDTDLSMGNASRKYLEKCLSAERTDWFNPEWSTMYLRKLMQHPEFKNDFVNQFAHYLNTALHRDTVIATIDEFENLYKDELPRPGDKIAPHLKKVPVSMNTWLNNVDKLRSFARIRPGKVWGELERLLAPEGTYQLKVIGDTGMVSINGNYGIPTPYEGKYFKGVPLPVEAVGKENWYFTNWSDGDTNAIKILNVDQDTTLYPMFEYREPVVEEVVEPVEEVVEPETKVEESKPEGVLLYIGYALLGLGLILLIVFFIGKKE